MSTIETLRPPLQLRKRSLRILSQLSCVGVIAFMPSMDGDEEQQGCGSALFSTEPAPDMEGEWAVEYDDMLEVEIEIGGAVYHEAVGLQGGSVEITHEGKPLTFDLECEREEVICPSEAWPTTVKMEQRSEQYPHQVHVLLPGSECDGELVEADASECGDGTANPECTEVCEGEVVTVDRETFGVLDEEGDYFDLLLGGGVASNGINCALLGISTAHADVETTARPWQGVALRDGEVVTGYAGGCLWAGDPDDDGELEALVIGATVKLTTGFSAERAD